MFHIVAAAGILVTGLTALVREWFWFSALRGPARNLDRIRAITQDPAETERLMRLLQDAENNVLTARKKTAGQRP